MIFWTGWGILAGLIWVVSIIMTQLSVDRLFFQPGYYTSNAWPKILASVLAAPIIWVVGRNMNGHPGSEQREVQGAQHTFMFVPMEYWGPLFIGFGVGVALTAR